MIKTYTYKIKPNKAVERKFEEQIGICRYVYNLAIEVREESFKKGFNINHYGLSKQLTEAKKEFIWLGKVHSHTLQEILNRLELGYKKFFTDLKKGVKTSKPKWAKKDKWTSLPFKQGNLKNLKPDLRFEEYGKFNLPKFGKIKLLHQKVSRVRKDFLHKQSRSLANNYSTIIREDLQISKMVKGSKLAKHILDCSWGLFFELLEYKTNVVKVNPAYTSQECSNCGHTCKENRKTQSLFECVKCGLAMNADDQACINILQRGQSLMEVKTDR